MPRLKKKQKRLKVHEVIREKGESIASAKRRAKKVIENSPKYTAKRWNGNKYVRKSHNCYTYFLNKTQKHPVNKCRRRGRKKCYKPQPGYHAGHTFIKNKNITCKAYNKRILADNKSIRKTRKRDCPNGYYLGALAVNPGYDYHFYRRDKNGYWSHKAGPTKATVYDASGKLIKDPKYANRKHGKRLNYKKFCGYYCIPNDQRKIRMRLRPRKKTTRHD